MRTLCQTGTLAPVEEPWTLIRQAIDDLEANENCDLLRIEMSQWFSQDIEEDTNKRKCFVCLAGGVMARRLNADVEKSYYPHDFQEESGRLEALNEFRIGNITGAYLCLFPSGEVDADGDPVLPPGIQSYYRIVGYHEDPEKFKHQMRMLANLLEAASTLRGW